MRKLFVGIVLIAIVAASLFAFSACNQKTNDKITWYPEIQTNAGMTAAISFIAGETQDDNLWRAVVNTGGIEEGYDQGSNDNNNWCNGHYYFDGEPGKSTLHLNLYDYETYAAKTGDVGTNEADTYNPVNITLYDENNQGVGFNNYIAIEPNEEGAYIFTFVLNQIAWVPDSWFHVTLIPPQDGTFGGSSEAAEAPEPEGLNFIETIVAIAVPVGVVVIAGIVVAVVLVKKNKKKKAAASSANVTEE